jgi:hypothetical protein
VMNAKLNEGSAVLFISWEKSVLVNKDLQSMKPRL